MIFIFIALAAASNAMMDTLAHHYYMFRWKDKVNENFWDPTVSWQNKYKTNMPDALTDAWHIFKLLMLFFMISAISVMSVNVLTLDVDLPLILKKTFIFHPFIFKWLVYCFYLTILGIEWILVFNLCYNKLFIKK